MARYNEYLYITVAVVVLVFVVKSNAYLDNLNKPCKYLDSINITDGEFNEDDGSITFDSVYYPSYLHAVYDYEFVNESLRQPVASHVRGCACKLAPCIRMCCPRGQYLYRTNCYANDSVSDLSVSVTRDGETFDEEKVFEIFNYVVGKPCHEINPMDPVTVWGDLIFCWSASRKIYEIQLKNKLHCIQNGSILMGQPPTDMINKNQYCLNPIQYNDSIEISLMTCFIPATNTKDACI